jgi:hypothetical protein
MNASSLRSRRTQPIVQAAHAGASSEGVPAAEPASPDASREAKLLAAAILEVLAGSLGPSEAARSLGISLARYYQLESRALAGLVSSCESRRRGKGRPRNELTALQRECEQLRRECARQQALMRATRRTVGLTAPSMAPVPDVSRKRRRRPTARALKMAAMLQEEVREVPVAADRPDVQDARDDNQVEPSSCSS